MYKFFLKTFFTLLLGVSYLVANEGITNAQDYKKNSTLQSTWAIESLETFSLKEDDCVLDLGCGDGSITAKIAAKVPLGSVIGVDISEEMLSYARNHYSSFNIAYTYADARNLPFLEQFDKAIAFLCLNWVKEQNQALSSLYAALKPGGKAIITRPGKQPTNLGTLAQILVKTERWTPYFPNFEQKKHYYSAEEYSILLENAGFIIEKITQDAVSTSFKDREALIGFFRPLCNFTEHLSSPLQEQFVEEIVDAVLEINTPLSDGTILLHDLKLEAIVSKPQLQPLD